jgi:tetratricopeptide (TPR) repeat protein
MIKKRLSEDPWYREYSSNLEKYWPDVLYYIGETYRRLGLYDKSLTYFNESIVLDGNDYRPYLGLALTYNALGKRQKTHDNIVRAEELTGNLEVKYYKEILGF